MLFRKSFLKQRIPDCPRKWDIDDASRMNVPNLRASELKFFPAEAMRANRNSFPGRHVLYQLFEACHLGTPSSSLRCPKLEARFIRRKVE